MSLAFLEKMKGSDKPFYLYHATRGCHFDNYPSDDWAGKSMARTVFSDCMAELDYILGKLVDKLAEVGELENTLIFFTSDNGPECEIPPAGRTPFRGCKGSAWEGGVRVPTFVYWKGMISARKSDQLFDLADLLPTALSRAESPKPLTQVRLDLGAIYRNSPAAVVGVFAAGILAGARDVLAHPGAVYPRPPLWDGKAAVRIADVLVEGIGRERLRPTDLPG